MSTASAINRSVVTAKPELASAFGRLAPITGSWNPLVRFAAFLYRMATGGVASPIEIIFARAPRLLPAHLILMATSEYGLTLDRRLRALVRVFGSRVNECMFCDDLETKVAVDAGAIEREDVDAMSDYLHSSRFSVRERAALSYVEDLNTTRRASDEAFENLRAHFSEKEIVEITWLNAVGNYLNLQAKPLGLSPEGECRLPNSQPAA